MVKKVCPFVLRQTDNELQILAFLHPLAGCQLIKGTVKEGEDTEHAVRRELKEESGISLDTLFTLVGVSSQIVAGEEWHFFETTTDSLPNSWSFRTNDGGGLEFQFFWHGLGAPLDRTWRKKFHKALAFYKLRKGLA